MAMQWTLTLKDAISGAASKAAASLGKVRDALLGTKDASDKADKALDSTFRDKLGRLRKSNGRFANEWVELGRRMFGQRFGSLIDAAGQKWQRYGGTIKKVGKGLAVGAALAAGAAAAMGAAIVKVVTEAEAFQSQKQKTLFAFDRLLGGPEEARKAWDMVRAASMKTRTSISETAAAFNSLLAAGFTISDTDTIFKQLASLKTLKPQADLQAITRAFSQIRSKGKLTAEELHGQLGEQLDIGLVYEELSKKLGKSRDEVAKLMSAGKIDAKTGIAAIQEAIARMTGEKVSEAGGIAGKAPKGLAETIEFAKDAFFDLLNLDFGPLNDLFARLTKGAGAEKFANMISRVFAAVTDPKALAFFEGMINQVGGGLFEGFADGFEAVADFFKDFEPGDMENFAALAKMVGSALGGLAAAMIFVSRPAAMLMDAMASVRTWFSTAGPEISASAAGLGSAITDGVINGIKSGVSGVVSAITDMARSAISAAEAELQIGSPSRIFDRIAGWTTRGFTRRIESDTPKVGGAISAMFARARAVGERFGGFAAGASTSTSSTSTSSVSNRTTNLGGLHFHGDGQSADERQAEMGRQIRAQLRSVLAQSG